jgi:HlyD family secretion protein
MPAVSSAHERGAVASARTRRVIVAVALAVSLGVAGAWFALRPGTGATGAIEASGTVEATTADLGFQTGGRVQEIAVREGDVVSAGALLAQLDLAEPEARRAAAEAQVAAARAFLRELERGARPEEVRQGRAAVEAAARQLEEAARTLERTRLLHEGGALSREALDRAETAHDLARTQHDQARERFDLIELGPREERIAAQRAAVQQAEAMVRQVDALLAGGRIHAPYAGLVSVRHREPGEVVGGGMPVLTVLNQDDRWVRIYVREDQVGRVALGQPARITADAYADRTYEGRVVHIASQAEFTPRNVQTREERVKLVYAVKVAITGDPGHDLKPGLPADVRLEARDE